ncbi:hypothetical protein [Geoalkalibacter subterraneus]|uniref:hypothetical protein n=1 Tax=Geoalkalibacter subterraneus TaxID=483547 RepID=UPI00069492D3|nr:hypothetical protein [Geoalkalibacter subterraneus]
MKEDISLLKIVNRGPEVVETNFWELEMAREGFFYLSFNAGAGRFLVPPALQHMVKDMIEKVDMVILTLGQLRGKLSYEILFEDHSDSPFSIHIEAKQADRILPESDCDKEFRFTIWTQQGKQADFPCRYRKVDRLPCLKPWDH